LRDKKIFARASKGKPLKPYINSLKSKRRCLRTPEHQRGGKEGISSDIHQPIEAIEENRLLKFSFKPDHPSGL
jgi:hypothetical protein